MPGRVGTASDTIWADNAPLAGQKVRQCYGLGIFVPVEGPEE